MTELVVNHSRCSAVHVKVRTIHTVRTSRSLPSLASPTHPFTCTPPLDTTLRLSGIPFLVGHLEMCTETRQQGKEGRSVN